MRFGMCLDHLSKLAEDKSERKYLTALKHVGTGALGLGLGTAAGRGAGHLLGKLDKAGPVPGARIARWAGPAAGAGLGLAYSLWKQKEQKEVARALENSDDSSKSGVSGQ